MRESVKMTERERASERAFPTESSKWDLAREKLEVLV